MSFDLDKYTGPLMWGLAGTFAPGILKGVMIEHLSGVSVKEMSSWIMEGRGLLDQVDDKTRSKLKKLAGKIGRLEWLTADWAIDAVRKEHPALASLFLGWPEARAWLEKQAQTIREELS